MRPYIAIIFDAFKEAAQSRVLWVLLFVWTVLLAAISPFEIIQGTTIEIQPDQIMARSELIDVLTATSDGKGTAAQKAVWKSIKPSLKQRIVNRQKNNKGGNIPMGELAQGLNHALDSRELYSEDTWPPSVKKRGELGNLLSIESKDLTDSQLKQRNRQLIELAYPGILRRGDSSAIWIGYAGIKISDPLLVSKKAVQPFIEGWILKFILQFGLGIVGVFVGIIVTSNMVPDMFQPGSLHLLLSKPISRSLLLLAKFIGGTAFIGMNVSYILVAFYFLVGWRLQIWNAGILICIPIFIFIFMVYYSVSMLAGLISKNAIIAIAVTGLFWAFCTTLGTTFWVMRGIVTIMPELTSIQSAHGMVVGTTTDGKVEMWDKEKRIWQTAFGTATSDEAVIGPFWMEEQQAFLMGRPYRLPFGGLQSDAIRFQIARMPDLKDSEEPVAGSNNETAKKRTAKADEATAIEEEQQSDSLQDESEDAPLWSERRIDWAPELPPRTRRVIRWNDTVAALTERGIYQLNVDSLQVEPKPSVSFLGFALPVGRDSSSYEVVTANDWEPSQPMDFAVERSTNLFAVYTKGQIQFLSKNEKGLFQVIASKDLELDEGALALVAISDRRCIVATNKNGIFSVSLPNGENSLLESKPIDCDDKIVPRAVAVSPHDGSFVILSQVGKLYTVAPNGQTAVLENLPMQKRISSFSIDDDGYYWIAHDVRNVTRWDPINKKQLESYRPRWNVLETLYHTVVYPLYWANPKPAAVDSIIQYSLTNEDPFSVGRETTELTRPRGEKLDIWQPVWSNALFICVMLFAGCVYLHRQDL